MDAYFIKIVDRFELIIHACELKNSKTQKLKNSNSQTLSPTMTDDDLLRKFDGQLSIT
jgi:hypothetical protein